MKDHLSRRAFSLNLLNSAAIASTSMLPSSSLSFWQESKHWLGLEQASEEVWLSAQGAQDNYALGWIDAVNHKSDHTRSPFRGHGLAQTPAHPEQVIMFARRPGIQGIRFNLTSGKIDGQFNSADNRHMHGHGCFSSDGQLLFCCEAEIKDVFGKPSGKGKITVRDAQSLKLINEFDSYGIGPHEIALMPDGHTLVVANGGLLTQPESGRDILNLDSMRSTLSYIDSRNGKLISEHSLAESKASIRHLDVAQDGTVVMALQVQRQAMRDNKLTPLAAIHKPELHKPELHKPEPNKSSQAIKMLHAPESLTTKLNDYMGSVRVNNQHRIAAFTSPKGDLALFWHLDDLTLQGYHAFHDVCGLTVSLDNKYFVLSNSAGKIRQINASTLKLEREKSLSFAQIRWDNHMITASTSSLK